MVGFRRIPRKSPGDRYPSGAIPDTSLSGDLRGDLSRLGKIFDRCSDVVFREFALAQDRRTRLALVYIDGLANKDQVGDLIIRALSLETTMAVPGLKIPRAKILEFMRERGLCMHQVSVADNLQQTVEAISSGDTVLLVDGCQKAIINGTRQWEMRAISESLSEPTVRGPRDSFVETLRVNTSLIRRRIRNPRLKIETLSLGEVSRTDVALAYVEGIAAPDLVAEVRRRLKRIRTDAILESGYVEELIEDNPWTPFPTVNSTERPDRAAAMLLEGRAAIIIDGTPVVLTIPNLFLEYLQVPEDYYERFVPASAIRLLRFLAASISLTLPAFYIAVTSFHQEMLPPTLLLSIAAQREATPFPAFVAVLIMEVTFEILREAGIRLPRPIGQAVGIVGALVVGEAAVRAGLVASSTVIVVALTGICSFVLSYRAGLALRLLRFPLIILATTLGLFGLISGLAVIMIHLCTLRSFGVPYLSPLVPTAHSDLKDTAFRTPWWAMLTRPRSIADRLRRRQWQESQPSSKGGGNG